MDVVGSREVGEKSCVRFLPGVIKVLSCLFEGFNVVVLHQFPY